MLAAIEIYNKPRIDYRDETFVILLLNAWELALKAVLSKHGQSIYYPKRRKQQYLTYAVNDAFTKAESLLPAGLSKISVRRNLELLSTYRDNAVHFYNRPGFGILVYALAQQSILNFVALLRDGLKERFGDEVTWHLLPLGLQAPVDPTEYIQKVGDDPKKSSPAVRTFIAEIARAAQEVSDAGGDAAQLITTFKVTLQSVKKLAKADAVVGVDSGGNGVATIAIVRRSNPNDTHPLSRAKVMAALGKLHPKWSTQFVLTAVSWKHALMSDERFCWTSANGQVRQYSPEVVSFVKKLSAADIEAALTDYKAKAKTAPA